MVSLPWNRSWLVVIPQATLEQERLGPQLQLVLFGVARATSGGSPAVSDGSGDLGTRHVVQQCNLC
ncbi:hypothetical protein GCM10008955_35030 [Deinococcus malanensis]|uniref:Uncharacterized protein n=1 Tax=Deinococcus malanensis TaxID=1706855 RepID=A0ABQ2F0U1_9DEIO|nr:hypothetical protein GCM10008955_35030 [Deinococcus malanensis]